MRKNAHRQAGFTLIELSISSLVLALFAAGILTIYGVELQKRKQDQSKAQMTIIRDALLNYRKKYNRLPCPASGTYAFDHANNGVEAANPGDCTGGTPAANFGPPSGEHAVGGVVPFKTLGLRDMLDPWGRRYSYHVDARMTATSAFVGYKLKTATAGNIIINNSGGDAKSSTAYVLVLSHGPNGHGAFLPSGLRYDGHSTNTDEHMNCHCDADAEDDEYDRTFILKPRDASSTSVLAVFDDEGFYLERKDLASQAEKL